MERTRPLPLRLHSSSRDPVVDVVLVEAMDEVHIAQFAALMRLLSQQHDRQIVIAVHERALFDYLALELSPSHAGDELITIELGQRSMDEDGGVRRRRWSPDSALAG